MCITMVQYDSDKSGMVQKVQLKAIAVLFGAVGSRVVKHGSKWYSISVMILYYLKKGSEWFSMAQMSLYGPM